MNGSERGTWAGPGRSGFGTLVVEEVDGGVGRGGRGDDRIPVVLVVEDKRDQPRRFDEEPRRTSRTCER